MKEFPNLPEGYEVHSGIETTGICYRFHKYDGYISGPYLSVIEAIYAANEEANQVYIDSSWDFSENALVLRTASGCHEIVSCVPVDELVKSREEAGQEVFSTLVDMLYALLECDLHKSARAQIESYLADNVSLKMALSTLGQ